MKFRGFATACVVLLILAGVLYWSEHRKPSPEANTSTDAPPTILKLDESAVTGLELKKKDAPPVVLTKSASGAWQISGSRPFRADQSAVSGMVSTLSSFTSERVVEEKAGDLKKFGLDSPAVEVNISEKDHKHQKLLLGDDTPAGGAVYAMRAGDPRVFAVSSFIKRTFDKSVDDLRNRKLFEFGFVDPDKIELRNGSKTYTFARNGADWSSNRQKMDPVAMQSFVAKLRSLTAKTFVNSGFTTPTIETRVTSDGGKRVERVQISKSGNAFIARRENEPDLYQLDSASITDLQKAAEKVRPAAPPKT